MKTIDIIIAVIIIICIVLFLKAYVDANPLPTLSPKNITIEHIENITTRTGERVVFRINASPSSDTMEYRATSIPGSYLDENGIFTWVPSHTQYGNFGIEVMAKDGDVVANETLTIYVEHINIPPVFHIPQSVTFIAGEPFELSLNATDPDGDEIRYEANSYPPSATFDNNIFRWTPDPEQYGQGELVFSAYDGWNVTRSTVYYVLYNQKMLDYQPPRTLENVMSISVSDDKLSPIITPASHHVFSSEDLTEQITRSNPGDIIVVHSGTYNGNLVINKEITLVGDGNPIIDAQGNGFGLALATGGISISGLTITNASTDGIKTYSSRNRIFNNIIIENNYGINMLYTSNSIEIYNNSIFNNTIGICGNNLLHLTRIENNLVVNNAGGGITIEKSVNVSITKNTIAFNGGNGVMVNFSHESTINGNIIEGNDMNGIFVTHGAKDDIRNNKISLNKMHGIAIDTSLDPTLRGDQIGQFSQSEYLNHIQENEVTRNRMTGIFMQEITASVSGNTFKYNDYGLMMIESAVRAENNVAMGNDVGFIVISSNTCVFTGNAMTQNDIGIYIVGDSTGNIITMNNISDNDEYGISFETHTRGNHAYENDALANGIGEIRDDGNNI